MLMISLTVMLSVLYMLIAGFALFMTYTERSRTGSVSSFYTALSVVACLVWPVTVMVVALVAVAMQQRTANGPALAAANKAQAAG